MGHGQKTAKNTPGKRGPQNRQVGRQPGGIQWNDLWLNMVGAKMREFHHKMGSESVILGRVHICTFYVPNAFWNGVIKR